MTFLWVFLIEKLELQLFNTHVIFKQIPFKRYTYWRTGVDPPLRLLLYFATGDFWAKDKNSDPFVMVLKNRYELCEDLKYVISVPDLCDVTFLVGPEKTPMYGIKAILATRSR